jgi:hypothetical protein
MVDARLVPFAHLVGASSFEDLEMKMTFDASYYWSSFWRLIGHSLIVLLQPSVRDVVDVKIIVLVLQYFLDGLLLLGVVLVFGVGRHSISNFNCLTGMTSDCCLW